MSMTYASLQAQVQDTLERYDLTNELPNFIYQAEQRICRESKSLLLEEYDQFNFTTGVSVYPKPAQWRRTLNINYGIAIPSTSPVQYNYSQIRLRTYEYCRFYWPNAFATSSPMYYADYGYNNYLVVPTPDQNYPAEYVYLQLPQPLSDANQTNLITDNAPDVLFYATMIEAVSYLKNEEKLITWTTLYKTGLASLNGQDDLRVEDRTSDRRAD